MTRDPRDYLEDMLAYAGKTRGFVEGLSFESFSRDEKTQMAVIRGLEVIGEAADHRRGRYPRVSTEPAASRPPHPLLTAPKSRMFAVRCFEVSG